MRTAPDPHRRPEPKVLVKWRGRTSRFSPGVFGRDTENRWVSNSALCDRKLTLCTIAVGDSI